VPPVSAVGTLPLATLGGLQPRVDAFRRSPSHVPCQSRRPGSRRLHAGHRLAREQPDPRFRCHLDCANDASTAHAHPENPGPGASGTSSWSPPDASTAPSPRSLTTTVFSQRSTGWFSALPRRTTLEGQQASISGTAPPL
jgi:hypothetical protein